MRFACLASFDVFPAMDYLFPTLPRLWCFAITLAAAIIMLWRADRRSTLLTFPLAVWFAFGCFDQSLSSSKTAEFIREVMGMTYAWHLSITGSMPAFVAGVLYFISLAGWRRVAATKPVEPTGTSSFPSDLITSHASGDSPGGSLRR